jgi:DNA repair protein RadD
MKRDMGIDAWDTRGNRIAQMKCYNDTICWRSFSTFLACWCSFFRDTKPILCRTSQSTLVPLVKESIISNGIIEKCITDEDFRNECKRIQELTFEEPDILNSQTQEISLYHYQEEALFYIREGFFEKKNVYVSIPTGCGKTLIIIQYGLIFEEHLLVLVPTITLLEQWRDECKLYGLKPFLIGTGHHQDLTNYKKNAHSIVLCVYNSIVNIHQNLEVFDRYVIDEGHHAKVPELYMYNDMEHDIYDDDEEDDENEEEDEEDNPKNKEKTYGYYISTLSKTNKAIYISATLDDPEDGSIYYKYDIRQAITDCFLVDYNFICPVFSSNDVPNQKLAQYLVYEQKETYCIVYVSSREEGKEFMNMLNMLESNCAGYVDGETNSTERKELFKKFEKGDIKYLVNVRVLIEGFNCPRCSSIFILNVSPNDIFFIQMIGRTLRLHRL